MTREQWLEKAVKKLTPGFQKKCGVKVPQNIRVSVSYPLGRSPRKVLGQCFDKRMSTGGFIEIVITPTVDDAVEIMGTLAHEMVHAIVGIKCGHKKEFSQCARRFGFLAPWTTTPTPRPLKLEFKRLLSTMPPFPHKKVLLDEKRKKQTTRMIKLHCEECGFICRASQTAIEISGFPTCGCGCPMNLG